MRFLEDHVDHLERPEREPEAHFDHLECPKREDFPVGPGNFGNESGLKILKMNIIWIFQNVKTLEWGLEILKMNGNSRPYFHVVFENLLEKYTPSKLSRVWWRSLSRCE